MNERAKLLSEQHWNGYIKPLLRAHGQGEEIISVVGFHYISAFQHGHRHGVEDQINREYEDAWAEELAKAVAFPDSATLVRHEPPATCPECGEQLIGKPPGCAVHGFPPSPGDITDAERERIVRCLDRNMSVEVVR